MLLPKTVLGALHMPFSAMTRERAGDCIGAGVRSGAEPSDVQGSGSVPSPELRSPEVRKRVPARCRPDGELVACLARSSGHAARHCGLREILVREADRAEWFRRLGAHDAVDDIPESVAGLWRGDRHATTTVEGCSGLSAATVALIVKPVARPSSTRTTGLARRRPASPAIERECAHARSSLAGLAPFATSPRRKRSEALRRRLVRDSVITCSTTGFAVVGTWTFTPDTSLLPVVTKVARLVGSEWAGPLATSGTITVDGWVSLVDFPTDSKKRSVSVPAVVTVTARAWARDTIKMPGIAAIDGGYGTMHNAPDAGVMTWGNHQMASRPDTTGVGIITIGGGPNAGYMSFDTSFKLYNSTVYLSPALDVVGAWAMGQTGSYNGHTSDPSTGTPYCTTAAFALLKPHVKDHEGLTGLPAPNSHWGIMQDQLVHNAHLSEHWEQLVRTTSTSLLSAAQDVYVKARNDASASQDVLDTRDSDATQRGWAGNCMFVTFPP